MNCTRLLILLCLASCASVPPKDTSPREQMCSGKSATKRYVWTISFHQGIPQGLEVSRVSDFAKNRSDLQDRVSDHFVKALLFKSSDAKALKPFDELLISGFIETGSSNFIFCIGNDCLGLKDPITKKVVSRRGDGKYLDRNRCSMYYVEGIIDPDDSQFRQHRLDQQYGGKCNSFVEWTDYVNRNSFGGEFLAEHYFSISQSAKRDLCARAEIESDCFGSPRFNGYNFITPQRCDIRNSACLNSFANEFPHQYQFLMDRNGMCGSRCTSEIDDLIKGLKDDSFLKQKWEDAVARDLFLKLSTSTTRKVEKDWVIHRIEFNPTLFCKYAQPNSDLRSK